MALTTYEHDPDGRLDYPINWAPFLDGDTISTSIWVPSNADIVIIENPSFTNTTTVAFVRFVNAVVGTSYSVTNRVTTAGGRTWDKTLKLKIKQY
jgi:hypothetical protein